MSKIYIYSTLSSDQEYGTAAGPIVIKGGANVADRRMHTPKGVVTEVTEEQLAELRRHAVFAAHNRNGFLAISKKELPERKIADVAADMEGPDKSAQETPKSMGDKKGRSKPAKGK